MREKRKTLWVSKKDLANYKRHLEEEPSCEDECLGENSTLTLTADFGGGMEMDVKICGVQYREGESNKAWSEAVLFKDGSEVCCSEPADIIEGEWSLAYEGTVFTAIVKEEPKKFSYVWTTMHSDMFLSGSSKEKFLADAAASVRTPKEIKDFLNVTMSKDPVYKVKVVLSKVGLSLEGTRICLGLFSGKMDSPIEKLEEKRKIILELLAPYIEEGTILYEELNDEPGDLACVKGYMIENGKLLDKKPVIRWE